MMDELDKAKEQLREKLESDFFEILVGDFEGSSELKLYAEGVTRFKLDYAHFNDKCNLFTIHIGYDRIDLDNKPLLPTIEIKVAYKEEDLNKYSKKYYDICAEGFLFISHLRCRQTCIEYALLGLIRNYKVLIKHLEEVYLN